MNPAVLVPETPIVVTTTSFTPAVPAGVTAVKEVELTNTTLVAATPPTFTVAPARKFVPVIVIGVPPTNGPTAGVIEVMDGCAT